MKPWLLDILACPIDKKFPLELYIFSYEHPKDKIDLILEISKNRDLSIIKSENIVKIFQENGDLKAQDDIVLKKTPIPTYLKLIKQSLNELNNIHDLSGIEKSRMLLNYIRSDVYTKIENSIKLFPEVHLDNILPELIIINKYKFELEIESGLLLCPACKRWFPIIDTIPQMLPDEYRDEKVELEFLKNIKNLLHEEFFQQDLKPYNL